MLDRTIAMLRDGDRAFLESILLDRGRYSGSPEDSDPKRYAVLACIPGLLVEAFNANIGRGLPRDASVDINWRGCVEDLGNREKVFESVPPWATSVPVLPETLRIPDEDGSALKKMDDDRAFFGILTSFFIYAQNILRNRDLEGRSTTRNIYRQPSTIRSMVSRHASSNFSCLSIFNNWVLDPENLGAHVSRFELTQSYEATPNEGAEKQFLLVSFYDSN